MTKRIMTMTDNDLWPDDLGTDSTLDESPLVFLRKQAAALGARLKNIVEADVDSMVDQDLDRPLKHQLNRSLAAGSTQAYTGSDYVVYRFFLRASALGNYRYNLFRAYHPVESFYPMLVNHEGNLTRIDSEKDLAECLRGIFSTESTRKVIATLMAQSRT
jgi:hypothetical protein